jgi:hypothetical protein
MLRAFIRSHELDIVLVQDVTAPESVDTPGYTSYTNIGFEMRGTAINARKDLQIKHINKIPSGRAIAVVCCCIRIINVYAPSGRAKRKERERFFNAELPVLFSEYTNPILLGGELNCILQTVYSTGFFTSSNALAQIVRGLRLTDMWNQDPRQPTYSHYSTTETTRIDRIYLSTADKERKPGIDGIYLEFYITYWTSIQDEMRQILNDIFLKKHITAQKKRGILICLPKTQSTSTPDSYRPISLLNTEYKLLARIMAHRLKPILAEQLSTCQYCGIPGRSIVDALATVRDVIAYHETTRTPLCLLSLDFRQAFDRISHDYLFQVLLP